MEAEVAVALEQLAAAERRVMELLFRDGRTLAETAKLVGKSEGSVVVTFSKGIVALRQIQRDLAYRPNGGAALAEFLKTAAASMKNEVRR